MDGYPAVINMLKPWKVGHFLRRSFIFLVVEIRGSCLI